MGRIAVIAVLALLALPAGAQAAFPGAGGLLVYTGAQESFAPSDIYTARPDGGGLIQLTTSSGWDQHPSWSPDGTKIAFASNRDGNWEIYVMNADGTVQTRLTDTPASELQPTWSPDGQRIAYAGGESSDIWSMNADGTGNTQLTSGSHAESYPAWSPDGQRIAFFRDSNVNTGANQGIWTMAAAGGGETRIVPGGCLPFCIPFDPNWAPDGSKLVYSWGTDCDGESCSSIDTVNPDGTGNRRIWYGNWPDSVQEPAWSPDGVRIAFIHNWALDVVTLKGAPITSGVYLPFWEQDLDWQPVPEVDNTPSRHARPKAATPFYAPLVPAYAECQEPNRVHAPPLSYPSCSRIFQRSDTLAVGAGSTGSVRLTALSGALGGTDEADLAIRVGLTDVVKRLAPSIDHGGELGVDLRFQITDREGAVAQTTATAVLSVTVPCTVTASTTEGSTCSVDTTAESLVPGAITEGARSILALDSIAVRDGGYDGDADTPYDDRILATQGVFVP